MSGYKDTIILAIIALIAALNLGILNYYKTANTLSWLPLLTILIKILVAMILGVFLFYIIILGLSNIFKKLIFKEIHPILYDIGLAITIIIVGVTLVLGLKVSLENPNYLFYINIAV